MSGTNTDLTNAEWNVMECLWEQAPRTVVQIAKYLKETVGWAKSTSTTMISRMEAKGLLRHEDGGRAKLYYPNLRREDAVVRETDSFINRVYRGSVGMLMSAIVEREQLSKQEIDELYALLQKAEEGNHA